MKAVYSILLVFCFVLLFRTKSAAQEYYQISTRSKSMAGISACLSDAWSVFGNQAGLAGMIKPALGISYSNFFMLSDLSLNSAFAAIPVDKNVFAVSFYRYGYEAYNENKLGFAFSKALTPRFSAGFQFNYFFIHLPENKKSPGDLCFEGGLRYVFSDKLVFGVHCFNPFQAGIKTTSVKYKIPCLFRFGAGTCITDGLWLYCGFEKDLEHDFQSKFGIEYNILNKFQVRGGVAGNDNLVAFGFAYLAKHVTTDFSWQYTYRLGSTPSVAISYRFK